MSAQEDALQSAAQQAGEVFSRKASGMTRVVSPLTALAYSFVAPNITQASFYLLWAVTLFAGAQMRKRRQHQRGVGAPRQAPGFDHGIAD